MTAQSEDSIVVDGELFGLCTEPLGSYLAQMNNPPKFESLSTACRRGYLGSWLIKENEFFLMDISIQYENGFRWREMFNGRQGDIKADWYSGILRTSQGEGLEYVITIDKGNVIKKEVVHNHDNK